MTVSALNIVRRLLPSRSQRKDWQAASDTELVLAARAQDAAGKAAFVEIVRRHQGAVAAVAFAVAGRAAWVDDIAQETFLKAWQRLSTLREPGRLKAWLLRIAHDCAVDALRCHKPDVPLEEATLESLATDLDAPDDAAIAAEEEAVVRAALESLPEDLRLPLVLFYQEGQSSAEVAAALDLSDAAVRQRLSRGREMLREQVFSRIEGVLRRARPSAAVLAGVALAIGFLAAPAALAAGAFSTAAAGAASTGSAATASTFSTAMTASSYLVATITLAAFIPLGWKAREPSPPASVPAPVEQKSAKPTDPFAAFGNSELLKEWRRLHEVHGTDAAAMPSLYDDIANIKDTFHRRALRSALLAEWASVDPAGAFRYLQVEKKQGEHSGQMFREWLKLDPSAAAAHLASNVSGAESMARTLLKDLAAIAPQQMAEIAQRLPASRNNWDREVADAFAVFAAKNPDAARAAAEAMTGANRAQALAGAAQGWAQKDGSAALAWSRTLTEGPERDGALRATLIGWAKGDPAAALANIDAAPPGKEEMTFASDTAAKVVQAASEKDFDGTMRWLQQNSGKVGQESWLGLTGVLEKKLNADPAALMTFLTSQPEAVRTGLQHAFNSVMLNEGYAQKDAVWSWLKTQPATDANNGLKVMMLGLVGWKEPELALQWMKEVPDSADSRRVVEQVFQSHINDGLDPAKLDALLAKAPEAMRSSLLATAFMSEGDWKTSDFTPWVARIAELPANQRLRAARSLASRMAATDPEAAAAWATSLTDASQRTSAIGGLTDRWARADSYEASAWIASLPAGPDRDSAAVSLVSSIAQSDPESAWTWAASIGDESERSNSLGIALMTLKERDPQRARQLVLNLDPAIPGRPALLEMLNRSSPEHPNRPN